MKTRFKIISIFTCLLLISLSGCQGQSEEIYQLYNNDLVNLVRNTDDISIDDVEDQGQIDETNGQLTICVPYFDWENYNNWVITEFNKKYPNIKITVTSLEGDYSAISESTTKVSVELMSGTAGDIIDLSGMPSTQYGKNKLLEDLYKYMDEDSEFYKDDYYTNILEALEYENKLHAIPMDFFYMCVRFNKSLLKKNQIEIPEGNSIDYKRILDIYNEIYPSNDKLILSHYWDPSILESIESISYFDYKYEKSDFDSPEYIEFLNEIKSIPWPSAEEIRLAKQDYYAMSEEYGSPDDNDLCFFVGSFYQDNRIASHFYDTPGLTLPIPMSATNGDKEIINHSMLLGIISSSTNKDLAWKFIKFCIEEKPIELLVDRDRWMIGAMPINRCNTLKMLEATFGEDNKEAVQMIDQWNSERNEYNDLLTTHVLLEAKSNILDEFYAGRITAEDCVRQIQERVDIFIKE